MDRFWKKTEQADDCLLWTAAQDGQGYGAFKIEGKQQRAHRVAWMLTYGNYPSDCLLHTCDTPLCVKVEHLREGSLADNNRDTANKGRHWQQQKTTCPEGHPYDRVWGGIRRCSKCYGAVQKRSREKRGVA